MSERGSYKARVLERYPDAVCVRIVKRSAERAALYRVYVGSPSGPALATEFSALEA